MRISTAVVIDASSSDRTGEILQKLSLYRSQILRDLRAMQAEVAHEGA